jgi:hypothetical protein
LENIKRPKNYFVHTPIKQGAKPPNTFKETHEILKIP